MKIKEITEARVRPIEDTVEQIYRSVSKNCKPFLNSIGGWKNVNQECLFHGRNTTNNTYKVIRCPKNRSPRDTPYIFHRLADEWFEDHTGIKFRSNSIFCTGSEETATGYKNAGTPEIVIPIGPFQYCWSPKIRDFTKATHLTPMQDEEDDREFIDRILEEGDFRLNSELFDAIYSRNEIMIHCDIAYAINISLIGKVVDRALTQQQDK